MGGGGCPDCNGCQREGGSTPGQNPRVASGGRVAYSLATPRVLRFRVSRSRVLGFRVSSGGRVACSLATPRGLLFRGLRIRGLTVRV